ncbi:endopeptidase [Pseudomonas fluorescens]|uniref:endopeptidase n=1 Tax=Pseudomonas fluorescens TaxID=294 RepID=UPI001A9F9556|nr:endopeptidase [Pseudomonas fluorescens]QTD31712.1 endopeptidase [Pseudomonas fluorescens]
MKVIFVHGRSQQHKDPVALAKQWERALLEGFTRIGTPYAGKLDFTYPYYGDALFDAVDKASTENFQELVNKGASSAGPDAQEQEFLWQVIREMAAQNGITEDQIAREASGDVDIKGLQNWPAILAALRLLDKIKGTGASMIELITRDVWYYLTKKGIRLKVNQIVDLQLPKDDECIIVAHSLGTIVAYNLLMNRQPVNNVKAFITLGSPLGIKAIYDRLPSDVSPRKAPPNVGLWDNLRDKRDTVALYEIGKGVFGGAPIVLNNSNVINGSDNRHGIVEYLQDPIVAGLIRKFLP